MLTGRREGGRECWAGGREGGRHAEVRERHLQLLRNRKEGGRGEAGGREAGRWMDGRCVST